MITAYKTVAIEDGRFYSPYARNWSLNGVSLKVEYIIGKISRGAIPKSRLLVFPEKEQALKEIINYDAAVLECKVSAPILIERPAGLYSNLQTLFDRLSEKKDYCELRGQTCWSTLRVKPIRRIA